MKLSGDRAVVATVLEEVAAIVSRVITSKHPPADPLPVRDLWAYLFRAFRQEAVLWFSLAVRHFADRLRLWLNPKIRSHSNETCLFLDRSSCRKRIEPNRPCTEKGTAKTATDAATVVRVSRTGVRARMQVIPGIGCWQRQTFA